MIPAAFAVVPRFVVVFVVGASLDITWV
ncbi:conserved hypothetical protein [Agrobacterium tumefaciens str. CFBP 5621]|nr:conserved hypothetical protein [Agrobacterium tumefaciens str. CFBP 5621]